MYDFRYADFILTKDMYHEVTPSSPMFGLDCEMCRTISGELELTRISIVNEQLEVCVNTTYVLCSFFIETIFRKLGKIIMIKL